MQLGMIGLGRMGANMVRRLLKGGHECVVFDVSPKAVEALAKEKARPAPLRSRDLVAKLEKPRAHLADGAGGGRGQDRSPNCCRYLERGDILDRRRQLVLHRRHPPREGPLRERGIHYVDVGTSGGVWGLERGYCMMIGGEPRRREAPRSDLRNARARHRQHRRARPGREKPDGTAEQGYLHCGPNGAGHFVKMVHNGIEYGLMAAYAEGLEHPARLPTSGKRSARGRRRNRRRCATPSTTSTTSTWRDIAEVWRRGSVIASWLLDLTAAALAEDPDARDVRGPRLRFRRRALDHQGGDRRRRARSSAHDRAVRALQLARRGRLPGQAPLRDALSVRRPCREATQGDEQR